MNTSRIKRTNNDNNTYKTIILVLYCCLLLSSCCCWSYDMNDGLPKRNLRSDPRTIERKTTSEVTTLSGTKVTITTPTITEKHNMTTRTKKPMPFKLPARAEEWCAPSKYPPLQYDQCKNKSVVNSIPIHGGLTNSLKMMLLGIILSFEEDRCFVVDETESMLAQRAKFENRFNSTFYDRYFRPIGLKKGLLNPETKLQRRDWMETWGDWKHNRRIESHLSTIESLGLYNISGHELKRYLLKRIWRPMPLVRDQACAKIENHLSKQLGRNSVDDFIAFSVRRGDKARENFVFPTLDRYIIAAERAAILHFPADDKMPTIFVATDDCSVMNDFRSRRPRWNFVSECDVPHHQSKDGFRIEEMTLWNHEATDAHFGKFMVELYAMAAAKYFIGVIYTNVTWWAYFMRMDDPSTFQILKTPGTENREGIDYW